MRRRLGMLVQDLLLNTIKIHGENCYSCYIHMSCGQRENLCDFKLNRCGIRSCCCYINFIIVIYKVFMMRNVHPQIYIVASTSRSAAVSPLWSAEQMLWLREIRRICGYITDRVPLKHVWTDSKEGQSVPLSEHYDHYTTTISYTWVKNNDPSMWRSHLDK